MGAMMTKTQIDALIVKLRELATPFDGGITGATMVEAASALELLSASKPAAIDGQEAVVQSGARYIVIGYGESDYPQAAFADKPEQLLDAVMGMIYTSPADADEDYRAAMLKDIQDDDEWHEGIWRTEFEIGGIVIYDLGYDTAAPSAEPTAQQTLSDGAQYFACYLIDNCENEVVREESVQAWLGKMLASPRYHPAAPSVAQDERGAFEEYRRGVKEAFHIVNMINANRQGRTAEETCSSIVRTLAEMVNSGEAPAAPSVAAQDERGALAQDLFDALSDLKKVGKGFVGWHSNYGIAIEKANDVLARAEKVMR
jgi:hypothetical protein